MVNLKKQGYL